MSFTMLDYYTDLAYQFYQTVTRFLGSDLNDLVIQYLGDSFDLSVWYNLPIWGDNIERWFDTPISELLIIAAGLVLLVHFIKIILDSIPLI